MKKMKKITALILAGVLCASSLSGIPAETLLASEEGSGTSTLEINFEDETNPFVSLNNEAESAWGIIESPVKNDSGNHLLKLTSPNTKLSKYKLDDEYLLGKTIKTVSGKIAHKKINSGVYIVTDYTDETTNSGFKIESTNDSNGTVVVSRVKARQDQATGLITNSSTSACDWTEVYPDVTTDSSVSCVVPFVNNTDYAYWVYFTLEYYTVEPQSVSDSGYRARMTITAPASDGNTQSISLTTVVSGPGSVLMFAQVGVFNSSTPYYVYLDDITVTIQEQTCAHTNVVEVVDEKYLASAGDCKTFKTYYKSCEDCGEAMSETFTSTVLGNHNLTAVPAEAGDCNTPGSKARWDCSVCEKQFYDENATQEVTNEEDLVIPAGHSWNEEAYEKDATQHWHTCSKCSATSEKEAHTWENDAENPNKLKCTKCGCAIDGLKINFEEMTNPFISLNNEAESAWGIIESPVKNDSGNHLLKLTSPNTKLSKYKLDDEYLSGKTIKTVSGKVAHKKATQGVYIVTDYTYETTSGFKIESKGDNNGTVILSRVKERADQTTGLINNSSTSSCDWSEVYPDVDTSPSVSCVVPFVNNNDYSYWVYFTLTYYTVEPNNASDSGYRAKMTITAPIQNEDKSYGTQSLTLTTVVSGPGSVLMFAPVGISGTNEYVYLDDITVTMQEQTCAHSSVVEVVDDKYLANAGDCETFKTYYKSCEACGERMSETFTSNVLGNHKLTEVPAEEGDCENAGSKAHWDCLVCEKQFYDEDATQEVTKAEELAIPAGHSWNEEAYEKDATEHWHTCSKCSTTSEKQAHTWGNDAANPNKLKCTECGYVTAEDVLPMICGAKILKDVTDADETQYLRYDIDFSAMRENAKTYGLNVTAYGVIAVGTTKADMKLEDVLELSKNNDKTVKSQTDLEQLGESAIVTVKIERGVEDYGRRTTIVAFMEIGNQRYYSNNSDYNQGDNTYDGVAKNGIASKGVMDGIKHHLSENGEYGKNITSNDETITYTQKAFDNFWLKYSTYLETYEEEFGIWGETPEEATIEGYLTAYLAATTVPADKTSDEYKNYQAAKKLAVCVFCEANQLKASQATQ